MYVRLRYKPVNTEAGCVSYRNNQNLSDLPIHCNEIEATAKSGDEYALTNQIHALPGLHENHYDVLSRLASPKPGDEQPSTPVLGVSDLLRNKALRGVGLHPRVTQIVPIENIDTLLNAVGRIVDPDTHCVYEHPDYLMEARGTAPEQVKLYPPEYSVRIGDILRDLRASRILTPIRRPGEKPPQPNKIEERVSSLDENHNEVHSVATLHQPTDASEPKLYFETYNNVNGEVTVRETLGLCDRLTTIYNVSLELVDNPYWRQEL